MLIDQARWCGLLTETGFTSSVAVPSGADAPRDPAHQTLLFARGPAIDTATEAFALPALTPHTQPGTWIVLGDNNSTTNTLRDRLKNLGEACITAIPGAEFAELGGDRFQVRPGSREDFQNLVTAAIRETVRPLRGVVHLWTLDDGKSSDPNLTDMESMQERSILAIREAIRAIEAAELGSPPRLWVVTRAAQDVLGGESDLDLNACTLWGLGRAIALEHWKLRPANIDLPSAPGHDEMDWLVREFWADAHEDQIALRSGQRYVKRLIPESIGSGVVTGQKSLPATSNTAYTLTVDKPGMIESVALRTTEQPESGPNEVLVKVAAAGVNFRDVLKVLGMYPMAPGEPFSLGDECAGTVIAVGEGAETRTIGERVIVIGPNSFSSFVKAPIENVVPVPDSLSFEQAAGLPTVFLTAHYALKHVARLEKGERILIHAAAGGVGIAAMQLAKRIGAEIFATAGTPEKRERVRSLGADHVMDSRRLEFAAEVMRLTHGEGVDVVLNSLSGEAIQRSLGTLRHGGRFVEIGKRDIYENSRIGLAAFKKNQSFHAIDLAQVFRARPDLARQMIDEIMTLMRSGELRPLPLEVFAISEAADAFRHMAQGKHMGKVVLSFAEPVVRVNPPAEKNLSLSGDGTYLVTGGLGGFGLAVAQWLADKGARHLALVGRSGAERPEAAEAIARFDARGVCARAFKADAANVEELREVFRSIAASMPPLRGIVHSAMVLDDVPFLEMTDERFWNVFRPKVNGAWNLHSLSKENALDFFLMFSSASSVIGGPGQANYGSANEFLSSLAHYRHARGLPATAINLGRLGDVGYVATHEKVGDLLDRYGIQVMPLHGTLQALEAILVKRPVQLGVMKMDWDLLRTLHPAGLEYPLLLHLRSHAGHGVERTHGGIDRAQVLALPPDQRLRRLEAHIRGEIAEVLQMDAAAIDIGVPLNALGLDSLVGIELRARLETDFDVKMPMTLLMQGPSIGGLAAYFLEEFTKNTTDAGAREVVEIDTQASGGTPDTTRKVAFETEREVVEL
jgi:NADPH:quinone reductase-like Zn-dependent oxidoreductase/acyl carrier protein